MIGKRGDKNLAAARFVGPVRNPAAIRREAAGIDGDVGFDDLEGLALATHGERPQIKVANVLLSEEQELAVARPISNPLVRIIFEQQLFVTGAVGRLDVNVEMT